MAYFGRGKNKVKTDYALPYLYKQYVKQTGNPLNLTKEKFKEVWKELSEAIWDQILYHHYEFTIPYRLGSIRTKFKNLKLPLDENGDVDLNKLPVDWKSTLDYWEANPEAKEKKELLRHFNEHTDGKTARIMWDKLTCITKHHQRYAFTPTRQNKRAISKAVRDKGIKYYE